MQRFSTLQEIDVGNCEVAFRETGAGKPILLVHGWTLCSQTWRKVVPELSAGWRCIALDLLGAGGTPAPSGASLGIGAQGELIEGFLDALGLDRVVLVGHNSGGSVARAFAVANPKSVSHLVLADTEIPGHRPPLGSVGPRLASLPGSRAMLAAVLRSRRLARLIYRPFLGRPGSFAFAEFFDSVITPNGRSDAAVDGVVRFLRDFDFREVDDAQASYAQLTMPKLLIWGERDRAFPVSAGNRLAEQLPDPVRFETVPGAGMFVHEESPRAWLELVQPFLEEPAL